MTQPDQNLDPFYPVFPDSSWVARLLPLGIKLLQLRLKDKSGAELREEISTTKKLTDNANCILVLNDYWQLALEMGCDFIHLGQEDLDGADIAAIKKANVKFGVSTHSEDELDRALSLDPDYIALGPVYPTILKKMPWQPQGLERVTQWKQKVKAIPLIAIGGLSLNRAVGVFEAGADAVAMVTDITLNPDPEGQVNQWLEVTSKYRKA